MLSAPGRRGVATVDAFFADSSHSPMSDRELDDPAIEAER